MPFFHPFNCHAGFTRSTFFINRPPVNGSCAVSPTSGFAFEDSFFLECDGWTDAETDVTKYYAKGEARYHARLGISHKCGFIVTNTDTNTIGTLVEVEKFPFKLVIGTGIYRVDVLIEDSWGATLTYPVPDSIEVRTVYHRTLLVRLS